MEEALDRFCRSVRSRYGERLDDLRLFGSYARGDAWEESDVDVLVLLRDATRQDIDDIVALADEAGFVGDGFMPIAPFIRTPEVFAALRQRELRIALDIDREGVPL